MYTNRICNCALPALTGSNKCCERCSNNTYQLPIKVNDYSTTALPSTTTTKICPSCGFTYYNVFGNEYYYCPVCGQKLTSI